ncbi:MAG: polyphosphate kinase 1 [Planctomycetes bacterium]|nr:polyphosphate kinase 1 [Planctomycetota bacterium]
MSEEPLFINRELSWLNFNRRVLEEALDETNPALERVKFLAICSTNLDEFFEVRVAGVMERVDAGLPSEVPEVGLTPKEELDAIRKDAGRFNEEMHRAWTQTLIPALEKAGIRFPSIRTLAPEQQQWLREYFQREVFPVLTPLAVDPAHPFPSLLNKSLNLAAVLQDPRKPQVKRMAVVQVPRVLSRLVRLPEATGQNAFVLMADLVREHLDLLFPGFQVLHATAFRVTRDGNLDVDEAESENLLVTIERELRKRRRGEPVRLEIAREAHPEVIERFLDAFGLEPDDVYFCDGPVNLGRLMELYRTVDNPALKDPPYAPRKLATWGSPEAMFAALREGDLLLHHPYDSFHTVEEFVRYAAADPRVLALKMTIYRAGEDSSIVADLIRAAENRKQVTVVVELKARFDEEANIRWARRMEQAGVHVVYGIVGLKTHAKVCLVIRREEDGIRRYCHLGTGNYNAASARVYTDFALMTAQDALCQDVADLFNMITGYAQVPVMRRLVAAPFAFRSRLTQWIEREIKNAQAGRKAAILAKMNGLADPQTVRLLYRASQAGVRVRLCVRGICTLRPGVPGLSENIQVVSIVDRFLEHSRIFFFENGGEGEVWLASADWMVRNLDYRVEAVFPVLDPALKKRVIQDILQVTFEDNVKAREILPDGGFRRVARAPEAAPVRSQAVFLEQAQKARHAHEQEEQKKLGRRRRTAPSG